MHLVGLGWSSSTQRYQGTVYPWPPYCCCYARSKSTKQILINKPKQHFHRDGSSIHTFSAVTWFGLVLIVNVYTRNNLKVTNQKPRQLCFLFTVVHRWKLVVPVFKDQILRYTSPHIGQSDKYGPVCCCQWASFKYHRGLEPLQ